MNEKLRKWALRQRKARREGKLSQKQIDLLDEIGFDWEGHQFMPLSEANPKLAGEWHPTKNGSLTPSDVAPGSEKKVWWRCAKGHEWETMVNSRSKGSGCPYCSGTKVLDGINDLATLNPTLAAEWHPTKNGTLTPSNVTPGNHKKVWWRCDKGHEWETTVNHRSRGCGCPYCYKQQNTKEK